MFFLNVGNSFCYPIYIILLIHRHGKVFRRPKCNEEVGGLSNQKNYAFPDASCTNDMKYLETGCSTKPKPCDWRGKLLQLEHVVCRLIGSVVDFVDGVPEDIYYFKDLFSSSITYFER
ncbi:uncharacterized protein [Dysidea avara]|uniref:uncharacterized protein isoform X1 n=1 Tax=Dysidea avara TaxID=196820 RepID=UPI0033307B9B